MSSVKTRFLYNNISCNDVLPSKNQALNVNTVQILPNLNTADTFNAHLMPFAAIITANTDLL